MNLTVMEQNMVLETLARRLKIARLRDFVKKGLLGIKFSFSSILCYSMPTLRANFTPPPPPPPPHHPHPLLFDTTPSSSPR
ncbi:MAG: hypothetical protein FWG98_01505 [Candidatus Cloacimonetes bacterium]|nr:hypothetical protein [Candidatus Cloacimonadota bacterium]